MGNQATKKFGVEAAVTVKDSVDGMIKVVRPLRSLLSFLWPFPLFCVDLLKSVQVNLYLVQVLTGVGMFYRLMDPHEKAFRAVFSPSKERNCPGESSSPVNKAEDLGNPCPQKVS